MRHCCYMPNFYNFMAPPMFFNPFMRMCNCNNSFYSNMMMFSLFSNMMNNIMRPQINMPMFQNIYSQNPYYNIFSDNTPITKRISFSEIQPVKENKKTEKTKKPEETNKTKKSKNTENIVDTGKLDKNFLKRVKVVAKNLNCDYKDLLALINSESSFNPQAGKGTNYVGLVQFGDAAIQELRTKGGYPDLTKEKILSMSAIEQLDLVEKLIKINKKYGKFSDNARLSAGDLYALIFAPGRAGREVLYSKGEAGYNSINSKMDYNKDGKITKSELAQRLDKKRVNESIFA